MRFSPLLWIISLWLILTQVRPRKLIYTKIQWPADEPAIFRGVLQRIHNKYKAADRDPNGTSFISQYKTFKNLVNAWESSYTPKSFKLWIKLYLWICYHSCQHNLFLPQKSLELFPTTQQIKSRIQEFALFQNNPLADLHLKTMKDKLVPHRGRNE